jgi:DNA primase
VARIKDTSVEAVKAASDIVEVVSARTPLRKAGARYTGRCPFHEERTPSFSVNPTDKLYHCFGCGAGGDLIGFVKETENLDFVGAIEWLADRFRITVEYEEASPRQDAERRRRKRLRDLLEQAAAFYERHLWETAAAEPARRYLAGRGLGEPVCREYRLGLAPLARRTLAEKAAEKGFTQDELLAAGLVNRRGNDYFSGRLLFPLADPRGRILGFQARRLRDDDPLPAKYVNSPESPLFQKGAILYGLDRARTAIQVQDRAIVVEGNTDVLALRQSGLEPVVASMGTALTERHLKELSRLTRRIWLCFDGDAAGEAAALRGMEMAARQGFAVKIVALPGGKDPADLAAEFERWLARAESYLVYRVRIEIERASDRTEAFVKVREVLAPFDDSPDRQDALKLAADRLDLPPETQAGLAPTRRAATEGVSAKLLERGDRLEREALAGVLRHPSLVPTLAEMSPDHFDSPRHRELQTQLATGGGGEPPAVLLPLVAELDALADRDAIDEATARELLLRLHERRLRRQLADARDDLERTRELQAALLRIRQALGEAA